MWPKILTRTTAAASTEAPSRTLFFWLIGAFLLTLLPHVDQLPGWLIFSIVTAMAVRCITELKRWPQPSTTTTGVVAICLLVGVYFQYNTILGHEAGTPFMAGLLAIKFYELRGPRDITLIIFSSFFVVMSALLFSQAVELFVYCLIMMWLLTGILLRTYMGDRHEHHLLPILRKCSLIFLQAVPLALLLFFFLPRYSGRFKLSFNDAVTGISDRVNPGDIAELSNDDSHAMSVTFPFGSVVPSASTMYWRAIVLWQFDGRAWTRGPAPKKGENPTILADNPGFLARPERDNDIIQQDIILWPQNQRWIPALDRPVKLAEEPDQPAWSRVLAGDVLVTKDDQAIDFKRRYNVTSTWMVSTKKLASAQEAPRAALEANERQAGLQLPDKIDPQVKALAARLFPSNHDPETYVNAVLHYFRANGFTLTNAPGRTGKDPVATFLFRTKTGFCEHYASAFGLLMRLEGVPARMVVGYRGGEQNTYGGFYMIRQSNAHAWDEVWESPAKGWVRVDPTDSISGTSIVLAANAGTAEDDDFSLSVGSHRFTFLSGASLPKWMRQGLRDVQMRREVMEAQWDDWVFSYDPATQDRLAQALGLGRRASWALLTGCLLVAGLGATVAALWLSRKKKLSPTERFYVRFCRRMAQRGAAREPWEGPRAYSERLAEKFPNRKEPIDETGWIVAEYRYGSGSQKSPDELKKLLQAASEKP
jgi:transglutaminase-like putative cysteine protease